LLAESASVHRYSFTQEELDEIFTPIETALIKAKESFYGITEKPKSSDYVPQKENRMEVRQLAFDTQKTEKRADHFGLSVRPVRKVLRLWRCPLCGSEQPALSASCAKCGAAFIKRRFVKW
jgi:hypothetical protein